MTWLYVIQEYWSYISFRSKNELNFICYPVSSDLSIWVDLLSLQWVITELQIFFCQWHDMICLASEMRTKMAFHILFRALTKFQIFIIANCMSHYCQILQYKKNDTHPQNIMQRIRWRNWTPVTVSILYFSKQIKNSHYYTMFIKESSVLVLAKYMFVAVVIFIWWYSVFVSHWYH